MVMNVKERILGIILEEKAKKYPKYAKEIGIEILDKTNNERNIKDEKIKRKN